MKTQPDFFIKKDFGFIDAGVTAAMGVYTIAVYEHMRRFVWRSPNTGSARVRSAFKAEKLVARISQLKLAKMLGVCRATVNRSIRTLVDCGWIEIEGETDDMVYILGEWVGDSKNNRHEVLYSDAVCMGLMEHLQVAAAEYVKNPKDDVEPSIAAIPIDRRIELTTEYLMMKKGKPLEHPLSLSVTGGVTSVTSPVTQSYKGEGDLSLKVTEKEYNLQEVREDLEGSKTRKELPTGGASLAVDCSSGERSESEKLTSSPPDSEDQETPPDDAARREKTAMLIEQARVRTRAAKDANLKRDSARQRATMNLGGAEGVKDPQYGRLVTQLQREFSREYKATFPEAPLAAWAGKEKGQVKQLVEKYSGHEVSSGLVYMVANWERISKRFGRKAGVPTPGFLLTFHSDLIPEAVRWSQVVAVKREYDEWRKANPKVFNVPDDLKKRYAKAMPELEALGLV